MASGIKLPELQTLILSSNNPTGDIPAGSLSLLKSLKRFVANTNKLNRTVPIGITRYVQALDLSYNQLRGGLEPDLPSSPTLEFVDLTANLLHGPIPRNFSRSLHRLRLGGNSLGGSIAIQFPPEPSLAYLELNNNDLDGEINFEADGGMPRPDAVEFGREQTERRSAKRVGEQTITSRFRWSSCSQRGSTAISRAARYNTPR